MLNRRAWVYRNCTLGGIESKAIAGPPKRGSNHGRQGTRGFSLVAESEWFLLRTATIVCLGCASVSREPPRSVPEMADPGEDHGHAVTVGCLNDLLVTDGSSRLDHSRGSRLGDFLNAVGKREESIGGGHGALQGQLRFHGSDLAGIDAAHLAGAHSYRLPFAHIKDRVRLYVLAYFPSEQESALFFCRGGT